MRVRPYEHLDNYVQRRAQMQIVSKISDSPSLARPRINYTYQAGEMFSSREKMYDECEYHILFHSVSYTLANLSRPSVPH
jgi:hypothetical protein